MKSVSFLTSGKNNPIEWKNVSLCDRMVQRVGEGAVTFESPFAEIDAVTYYRFLMTLCKKPC